MPMAVYLAGLGLDTATTAWNIHQGIAEEANPVLKGLPPQAVAPVSAAVGVGVAWMLHKALHKKHPTALKVMLYTLGGFRGAAGVWNLSQR